jgi:small subunit ribosomal protein S16
LDEEKAREWLGKGAQPTDQVRNLLKISGVL